MFSSGVSAEENANPLENFLTKLESYKADFRQVLTSEHGEILEESTGVVYMQNPGKFRWVYEEPYSQVIVTDSVTLWLYDQDLQQVTIRDISKTIDSTPAAIISGQEKIDQFYVTVDLGEIEGHNWVELTPKDIENQYKSVKLGFDNESNLAMMILSDNLGQITRIDFSNPVRNKRLGGPLFLFEIPQGVDVIDDRIQEENKTESSAPSQ